MPSISPSFWESMDQEDKDRVLELLKNPPTGAKKLFEAEYQSTFDRFKATEDGFKAGELMTISARRGGKSLVQEQMVEMYEKMAADRLEQGQKAQSLLRERALEQQREEARLRPESWGDFG